MIYYSGYELQLYRHVQCAAVKCSLEKYPLPHALSLGSRCARRPAASAYVTLCRRLS